MDSKAIPYILFLGVIFGTSLVVSRLGIEQIAPTTFIGLRFTLASLVFAFIFTSRIGDRRWPKGTAIWGHGFVLGVFGTAMPMTGVISSLEYLSSGLVSILITVSPAFTVLMAHFFLQDESLNRRKGVGVTLALGGAILLVILGESGLPDVGAANPFGYFLVLGGMLAGSAMTVYARKYMQNFDTFDVTGIRLLVGAALLLPFSYLLEGFDLSAVDTQGIMALLFAAFAGSFFGMMLSLYNIQRFGATAAVMTTYVVPIVAGLVGVVFLQENFTWGMAAGILFIVLGVWLINRGGEKITTIRLS